MLSAFLLVIAVCIDAFATSVTYGMGKIKIPVTSAVIISGIGTGFLAVSILFARILSNFINPQVCTLLSVILLIILGVTNLFQNSIKAYLRKNKGKKNVSFSFSNISFIIDIILDETKADVDNSKVLSPKESLMLAIALSIDSIATGFSAGLCVASVWETIALSFIIGFTCVKTGCIIGERISRSIKLDLAWLSGVILIILAVIKLL